MPTLMPEAAGLHLGRTLDSGQVFRWRWSPAPGGGHVATGVVGAQVLRLAQDARGLWLLSPETPEARVLLRRYLGVAARTRGEGGHGGNGGHRGDGATRRGTAFGGLVQIEAALARDPVLARILPHTRGISILAQDPWEVLISFIISQNNNIPKITQSIDRLVRACGEPLPASAGEGSGGATHDRDVDDRRSGSERPDGGGETIYAFPTPERLAGAHPRTLRACLLGYRAPYVKAAARMVAAGVIDLPALQRTPASEARDALRRIPGVGEKVGDCILLFGLRQMLAFPVDVWVRRAVERLYFRNRARTTREIQAFAQERFGPLAGYAQQHLFTYARARLRG